VCNGTYNGAFNGNITVSPGQNCNFTIGTINGNITLNGGRLTLNGTMVTGNVQVNGGGTFNIGPGVTINGDLQVQNTPPVAGVVDQLCGSTVNGNLQIHNNATAIQIGGPSLSSCLRNQIGGDVQLMNNVAPVKVLNNTVKGSLQCQGNTAISGSGNAAKQKQGQCVAF
jgi:hypothetical protein